VLCFCINSCRSDNKITACRHSKIIVPIPPSDRILLEKEKDKFCIGLFLPNFTCKEREQHKINIANAKIYCNEGTVSCCYALAEYQVFNTLMFRGAGLSVVKSVKTSILDNDICEVRKSIYYLKALKRENIIARVINNICEKKLLNKELLQELRANCSRGYLYACQYYTLVTIDREIYNIKILDSFCTSFGEGICNKIRKELLSHLNNGHLNELEVFEFFSRMCAINMPFYCSNVPDVYLKRKEIQEVFIKSAMTNLGIDIKTGIIKKLELLKAIYAGAIDGHTYPGNYAILNEVWTREEKQKLRRFWDDTRENNCIDIFSNAGKLGKQ